MNVLSFPRRMILMILFSSFFFLSAHFVWAADLSISPSTGSYSTNQTFTATVRVLPNGENVNAVEANLNFDSTKLSVVSVSKTGSIFSLWTTEPTFSNSAGTISFGGGSPSPFSAASTLVTVTFRAIGEGDGVVSFGDGTSVLAADGRGTDVLNGTPSASFTIGAATEPVPATETSIPSTETSTPSSSGDSDDATIAFGDPPRAPEVGSQAFLDPDIWYSIPNGLFTWDLPFDVSAVAVEIATSSENDPSQIFDPPVDEFAVSRKNIVEGIQYLSIKFQNQVGWGTVSNRILKIDTTNPEEFDILVQAANNEQGFPLLVFDAKDGTSGIERYELFIADREPVDVTPDEALLGYLLGALENGTYTVRIIAYDKAGNSTESSVPVLITAGWIAPSDIEEEKSFWSFLTPGTIFLIILILLVVGEFIYIVFERKQFSKKEEKLRKETREIHDQMEKIFSALRDEIYDQVNTITKRPRLSKKEKEAVDGLNQALEVSETLIEKEINDVKKILK